MHESCGKCIPCRAGTAEAVRILERIITGQGTHDDLERLLLARSPDLQTLLDQSRQSIAAGHGLTREAFWEAVSQQQNEED